MLKRRIDKTAYNELSDAVKAVYAEKNGNYVLQLDSDDDDDAIGELRRAKDREAQENKENKRKVRELQAQLDDVTGNDAKKRGDIETLEKSWIAKYEKLEADTKAQLQRKDSFIQKTLVDSVATQLASEISTAPAVMLPHIKARLTADLDGDVPATKILDTAGQLSALTLDDLKKEFIANKDFSAIIVSSKASGSGASTGGEQRKQTGVLFDVNKPQDLSKLPAADLVAHIKAKNEAQT